MVEMRADILFDKPIKNYINEMQRNRNAIVINLHSFYLGQWTDFMKKYNFVETSPLMMDAKCTISGAEFLALVGATHKEAIAKLETKFPDLENEDFLQAYEVKKFYKELEQNTIKEVTLRIVELW
jgi:hypothetical protein